MPHSGFFNSRKRSAGVSPHQPAIVPQGNALSIPGEKSAQPENLPLRQRIHWLPPGFPTPKKLTIENQ
ncbi:hypothetical protein [Phormidium sp. CCY1219]|uniref:hypothetical protein n=1 Tax=Phormidium sp. CCY1219 TaxID=2886104 RepID=UPI002D1E7C53|nr:hypothetical protein [Phormidium sp. CCY1219]MEB3828805.1 hypothetical protein [Phormidium sp. CCY1219]